MTMLSTPAEDELLNLTPDKIVGVRETFGVDSDMKVPAFSVRDSHVPDFDDAYQFDPQTNVVDVYIGYLRRKLGSPGNPAPILTVRSVGYRLDDAG